LPSSRFSRQSCSWLCCACMCFSLIFALICLSRMSSVAAVVWFFAADTWPLVLLSTDALLSLPWAEILPPMSLPSRRCFVARSLADALPQSC
jgi:hypothetical protein